MSLVSNFIHAKVRLNAEYRIRGDYIDDSQIQARLLSNRVLLGLDYDLLPQITLHAKAGGLYEIGSNKSIILDEYQPQSQLVLNRAFLQWSPFQSIKVDVGAIPMGSYNSSLLITNGPFLGAVEKLGYEGQSWEVYLKFVQAIPNNNDLSRRVGFVSEGTPKFFMETAGLRWGDAKSFFKVEGSTFRFNSLGSVVAYNSQFLGNSVSGGSTINSAFVYDFSGFNFMGETQFMFNEMYGLNLLGQYLYNEKAPDGRNSGHLALGGLILGDLTLKAGIFENQADSSPAFYNTGLYGHNNRSGYQLGFESIFPSDNILIRGYYIGSSPIENNVYQSDRTTYYIELTKKFNLLLK